MYALPSHTARLKSTASVHRSDSPSIQISSCSRPEFLVTSALPSKWRRSTRHLPSDAPQILGGRRQASWSQLFYHVAKEAALLVGLEVLRHDIGVEALLPAWRGLSLRIEMGGEGQIERRTPKPDVRQGVRAGCFGFSFLGGELPGRRLACMENCFVVPCTIREWPSAICCFTHRSPSSGPRGAMQHRVRTSRYDRLRTKVRTLWI